MRKYPRSRVRICDSGASNGGARLAQPLLVVDMKPHADAARSGPSVLTIRAIKWIVVVFLAVWLLHLLISWANAAGPDGQMLFLDLCASCHGTGGRGDGPDATLFRPPPRNLRDGFVGRHETPELVATILDGARRPLALDPEALRARLRDTEAIVAYLQTIPDQNRPLVERGRAIYVARCESCHGAFGRPPWARSTSKAPRDLSSPAFQEAMRDEQLVTAVRHGRAGMPPIPAAPDDAEARALVAWVRLLSPGFELYSRHCASCHGEDGRPQREFVEPRHRPTVVFERGWLARRDPTQLRAAVLHMLEERQPGMPHFRRTVSEPEARAILRYLRGAS
jgi:mono/diheme cytochrome c family protein